MTDNSTEAKALALVNEVRAERGWEPLPILYRTNYEAEALCRAIEQSEDQRQPQTDAPISNNQRVITNGFFTDIKVALGEFAYCVQGDDTLCLDMEQAAQLADMLAAWAHNANIPEQTDALKIAREDAIEECASKVEDYPSPLDDLPMAMAMRNVAAAIRRLKEQSK